VGRLSAFCAASATFATIPNGSPSIAETVTHVLMKSRRETPEALLCSDMYPPNSLDIV
jgi:hypothetical protein